MRIKAMDDRFGTKAYLILLISFAVAAIAAICLIIYFDRNMATLEDDISQLIIVFIPFIIVMASVSFPLLIAFGQRNTVNIIGKDRYVTYGEDAILLEDTYDGEKISRTYAWSDIKRITVCDVSPFLNLRKTKTQAVRFIIDDAGYKRYKMARNFSAKSSRECLGSFFAVMKNDHVMDAIAQHWDGNVETDGRLI